MDYKQQQYCFYGHGAVSDKDLRVINDKICCPMCAMNNGDKWELNGK